MIIALEGIDASGKETQCTLLQQTLAVHPSHEEKTTRVCDFPNYESVAGGVVGRILRGDTLILDNSEEVTPESGAVWSIDKAIIIQSVMIADRMEWQSQLFDWYADLGDGVLILDRYKMSGLVYGQADGITRDWIMRAQSAVIEPYINILIDITVEESVRRRPDRQDYYEKNFPKLRKVRDLYLEEFDRHSSESDNYYFVVDGMASPEVVQERIMDVLIAVEEDTFFTTSDVQLPE